MGKEIVIVGYGGMGREVLYYIDRINRVKKTWDFLGFIDVKKNENVIGDDSWLMKQEKEINAVMALGSSFLRQKLYAKYKYNKNIRFPNIIDPSVIISDEQVKMGQGNVLCIGTTFTTDIFLGDFNVVSANSTIGHDAKIGDFVTILPGCNISGNTFLGDGSEIGTGSQIIQEKKIGNNVIIGAGTVVISNLEDNVTAVGVPARVIKKRG